MKMPKRGAALTTALLLSITATLAPTPAPASAETKDPVIIVAGTFAGQGLASVYYAPLKARLQADGYRAYIFGLPNGGLTNAVDSAKALNSFADSVRASTGSARVDLIAHSQGAMVSRYYIKHLGGVDEVDSLISLAGVMYGTTLANLATLLGIGNCLGFVGCQQMSIGSSFLNDLNAGSDTSGTVAYTNIATNGDLVILPYTNTYLRDGPNYVNSNVRGPCWGRVIGHVSIALDGAVYSGIQDALAKRAISYNCWAL